jgi:hypothetical protein
MYDPEQRLQNADHFWFVYFLGYAIAVALPFLKIQVTQNIIILCWPIN